MQLLIDYFVKVRICWHVESWMRTKKSRSWTYLFFVRRNPARHACLSSLAELVYVISGVGLALAAIHFVHRPYPLSLFTLSHPIRASESDRRFHCGLCSAQRARAESVSYDCR